MTTGHLTRTLPGRVAHFARERPNRVALREKRLGIWEETTWLQYYERVHATARMMHELGVSRGDHVSILSDNRTEWLFADLAAQAIGARSVGIYQTNPAEDVAYVLDHSKSRIVFCEDQEQVDKVVEVAEQTKSVEHVVVFDPRGVRSYEDDRLLVWSDFLQEGLAHVAREPDWIEEPLQEIDPDEACMVIYTSGTTGTPKGGLLSSTNVVAVSDALSEQIGFSEKDTMLSYLPLCHVAEKIFSLFIPLATGGIVHFGESIETVQQDLREVSPTVFLGVPRIWEKMHASIRIRMQDSSLLKRTLFDWFTRRGEILAEKRRTGALGMAGRLEWFLGDLLVFRPLQERLGLRGCRFPVTGAAPISPDLLRWFHGVGVPVLEGYGMTESTGVSHVNRPGAARLGAVGRTLSVVECETAEDGEILVRGPSTFVGYLHDEGATREVLDERGWLHTGDVGEIDGDGFLRITGRKKEIIITAGGKNLSPEKIENALKLSPYVKEAVAIGDRRKFVSALVQIEADAVGDWAARRRIAYGSFEDLASKPEVEELISAEVERSNEHLARVEQVRAFRLFPKELHQDDGELTATQKVRRRAITEIYGELIEGMYG